MYVSSWEVYLTALSNGLTAELTNPVINFIERLFVFIPLGFLLQKNFLQKQINHHYFISIACVVVFAILVECLQAGIIGRHARLIDVMFAIISGGLGATIAAVKYEKKCHLFQVSRFAIVVINVCVIWIISAASLGVQLTNWNCDFPLVLANESTGDRPWLGRMHGFAIYANELSLDQIRLLKKTAFTSEGEKVRRSMGAIVLATAEDRGQVPVLQYRNFEKADSDGIYYKLKSEQLNFNNASTISSLKIGKKMCEDILQQQQFTIEVLASNFDFSLSGPARIISNSTDPSNRNFTLGQEKEDIVFRVRSFRNGVNGSNLAVKTQGDLLQSGENHIVASYGHGKATLVLNGKNVNADVDYSTIFLLSDGVVVSVLWWLVSILVFGGLIVTLYNINSDSSASNSGFYNIKINFFMISFFPLLSCLILVIVLDTKLNLVNLALIVFLPLFVMIGNREISRRIKIKFE